MKHFVILLLIILMSNSLVAQIDKTTDVEMSRPGLILKWSPLSVISFTAPTLQFSLEHPIGKKTQRHFLEYDLGYVFNDPAYSSETSSFGFRVGTKIKYYMRPANEAYDNFFVSLMGRLTYRYENGGQFFERGGGAYQQFFPFTKLNRYASGYGELGYFGRFGDEDRATFEILGGLGFIYVTDHFSGIPDDAVMIDDNRGFSIRRDEFFPSIIVAMKFGYILK